MLGDLQDLKHVIAVDLASAAFLAVLAAVDLEKGVTLATPGPTQVFEGEKFVKTGQGFPVAEVIGIRTVYDSVSEQTKSASHELQIMWTHVGDDELTITAQLERLVRATRDLLWPANGPSTPAGVNAAPLEIVSEEYTALMPAKDHPFMKGSATTLRVQTFTL